MTRTKAVRLILGSFMVTFSVSTAFIVTEVRTYAQLIWFYFHDLKQYFFPEQGHL